MKRSTIHYSADPGVAVVGALIGDPVRAAMLCALLGGDELTAGELAARGAAAPNAASAHLAKLVDGKLLTVRPSGRTRLFRLASADVGRAIEALSLIAPPAKVASLTQARISDDLRLARSCYDHLAGKLGVAVTESLLRRGSIVASNGNFEVTASGLRFFERNGVDVERARSARRMFAPQCTDWSERRPHLAGALGGELLRYFLAQRFVQRRSSSRALAVTDRGRAWLASELQTSVDGDGNFGSRRR